MLHLYDFYERGNNGIYFMCNWPLSYFIIYIFFDIMMSLELDIMWKGGNEFWWLNVGLSSIRELVTQII